MLTRHFERDANQNARTDLHVPMQSPDFGGRESAHLNLGKHVSSRSDSMSVKPMAWMERQASVSLHLHAVP